MVLEFKAELQVQGLRHASDNDYDIIVVFLCKYSIVLSGHL